jgi:hypothetical protein
MMYATIPSALQNVRLTLLPLAPNLVISYERLVTIRLVSEYGGVDIVDSDRRTLEFARLNWPALYEVKKVGGGADSKAPLAVDCKKCNQGCFKECNTAYEDCGVCKNCLLCNNRFNVSLPLGVARDVVGGGTLLEMHSLLELGGGPITQFLTKSRQKLGQQDGAGINEVLAPLIKGRSPVELMANTLTCAVAGQVIKCDYAPKSTSCRMLIENSRVFSPPLKGVSETLWNAGGVRGIETAWLTGFALANGVALTCTPNRSNVELVISALPQK